MQSLSGPFSKRIAYGDNRVWTGGVTTAATRPVAGNPGMKAWVEARIKYLRSLVTTTGQTTYYFDPIGGSNANNGLTSGAPKQTIAAANTLLQAGNCRILLKRGTVKTGLTTGLDNTGGANCSIGAYGSGPDPELSTSDLQQASGASWTSDGSNSYYVTRAGATKVGGVRNQGCDDRWYAKVSSVAECQALSGSYYHETGANRLHVHEYNNHALTGGADPVVIEVFPENASDGIFHANATGSMWIDGIRVVGFGMTADGSKNAKYGIHSQASGSSVCLVTNCTAVGNNNHNIGLEQGVSTGGILVCVGCKAGFLTNTDTPYVAYAGAGGQEMYLVDCEALGGEILSISSGVPSYNFGCASVQAWLAHTSAGNIYATFAVALRMKVRGGPMQCSGFINGTGAPASLVPTEWQGFCIDCEFEGRDPGNKDSAVRPASTSAVGKVPYQLNGGNKTDGFTCVYINCKVRSVPQWVGSNVDLLPCMDKVGGLWLNPIFEIDWKNVAPTEVSQTWGCGFVNEATDLTCSLYNYHIVIRGCPSARIGLLSRNVWNNSAAANQCPVKFEAKDGILTIKPCVPAQAFLGAGNNRDTAGTLLGTLQIVNLATNCIASSDTVRGDDQVGGTVTRINDWAPGQMPLVGDIDAVQQSILGTAYYVGHDFNWRVRRPGTTAMGPVEAV